ncbi:MAG: hypothetical protein VW802_14215 [Rhodospirillaceae bacterium]|jgi:tripartite-type tricarboxylate transporter receptor subunit TctC
MTGESHLSWSYLYVVQHWSILMKRIISHFAVSAGVLSFGAAIILAAPAKAVDFSGKKIQLIVPFKEGGGGDRYGRLWRPFLQKHLPGNPRVLVVNKPGGGSIRGNNWFEANAKNDGSMAMIGSTSTFTSFVFGGKKVKYNMINWRAVITSPLGTQFYARADTGMTGKDIVADIKALRGKQLFAAGKTPTSAELRQFLLYDLFGLNVKPVFGLSSGKRRKATLRGEIHLTYDSTGAFVKKAQKYVKKGTVVHYMTFGIVGPGNKIIRDPAFPNLPTAWEVYKMLYGKELSGKPDTALRHILNMGTMASKALLLPKGTSDAVYNAYLDAVKKSLKDKKFQKIAEKEIGSYPQALGKEAESVIKNAVDIHPSTKKWLTNWIKNKFNVSL